METSGGEGFPGCPGVPGSMFFSKQKGMYFFWKGREDKKNMPKKGGDSKKREGSF